MIIRLVLLVVAGLVLAPHRAEAQILNPACTFTIPTLNFGEIDVVANAQKTATTTITIACTGLSLLARTFVCVHLGAGTGGAAGALRHMTGPLDTIDYVLRKPDGMTAWGGTLTAGLGTQVDGFMNLPIIGTATLVLTVNGLVPTGQQDTRPGSYASTMNVLVQYRTVQLFLGELLAPAGCTGGGAFTANPTFLVNATVSPKCTVSAVGIDFGTHAALATPIPGEGDVDVACTNGTAYTVNLDGGETAQPPGARLMRFGADDILYGLYKDAGFGQPFGTGVTLGLGGTGTGFNRNIPVYGLVPPQPTPAAGLYDDRVIVTITY